MNTHENYVSLEVAKLLKEAGFDWECNEFWMRYIDGDGDKLNYTDEFYLKNGNSLNWNDNVQSMSYDKPDVVIRFSAPTLSVAQKWLREVKGYEIYVRKSELYYGDYIFYLNGACYVHQHFLTYEEAQEAGIKKCLTLILEKV